MVNPNDPAFPTHILVRDKFGGDPHQMTKHPGMSIRTQLAAMAMQGILANSEMTTKIGANYLTAGKCAIHLAQLAKTYADALIEELNKEKK